MQLLKLLGLSRWKPVGRIDSHTGSYCRYVNEVKMQQQSSNPSSNKASKRLALMETVDTSTLIFPWDIKIFDEIVQRCFAMPLVLSDFCSIVHCRLLWTKTKRLSSLK